ncbi:MAG: F0F1 ATP synthase subunit gamma [Anaerolineae bacterium]|nr:F0F1 ATP synthase subunit gamma [Anaerolineae bacterium]
MPTLESLRRKIQSAEDLQSVVKTMKALAAANIWQYEQAVEALADYSHTIEMGLQIVLSERSVPVGLTHSPAGERLGAVVIGSDQGMVGRFNEQVITYALDKMNELQIGPENRKLLSVGLRMTARLSAARQPISQSFSVPSSIAGITPLVQELLVWIENWREQQNLDRVVIFHNRPRPAANYEPNMVYLLPINLAWLKRLQQKPWSTRVLPTFTMDWESLFSALIRQHFFVALYQSLAESLASENASRLASMQAAEKNIEEQLDELHTQFHQERQRSITEELLDIVSGFEALTSENRD